MSKIERKPLGYCDIEKIQKRWNEVARDTVRKIIRDTEYAHGIRWRDGKVLNGPAAAPAAEPAPVTVRLSDIQIDKISEGVWEQLGIENSGIIGGGDAMTIAFPNRFAKALMAVIGIAEPCCSVCGDAGKWLAGYAGLFDCRAPVYEVCDCRAAALPQPPQEGEFFAVLSPTGEEGVIFKDEGDAKYTATGITESWGVPSIGDALRDSYADDAGSQLKMIRVAAIAPPKLRPSAAEILPQVAP